MYIERDWIGRTVSEEQVWFGFERGDRRERGEVYGSVIYWNSEKIIRCPKENFGGIFYQFGSCVAFGRDYRSAFDWKNFGKFYQFFDLGNIIYGDVYADIITNH